MGFRVWVLGLGFRVSGGRCNAQGLGLGVQGSGCGVQGSGFRVQGAGLHGSGFRVQGLRVRVYGLGSKGFGGSGKGVKLWVPSTFVSFNGRSTVMTQNLYTSHGKSTKQKYSAPGVVFRV